MYNVKIEMRYYISEYSSLLMGVAIKWVLYQRVFISSNGSSYKVGIVLLFNFIDSYSQLGAFCF